MYIQNLNRVIPCQPFQLPESPWAERPRLTRNDAIVTYFLCGRYTLKKVTLILCKFCYACRSRYILYLVSLFFCQSVESLPLKCLLNVPHPFQVIISRAVVATGTWLSTVAPSKSRQGGPSYQDRFSRVCFVLFSFMSTVVKITIVATGCRQQL